MFNGLSMAMSHARLLMGMSMPWALRARATLLESICKTLQAANRRCLWLPHLVEDVNLVEDVVFDPRYTEAMLGMDLLDMMLDNTGNLTPVPVQTLATSETCLASENHACWSLLFIREWALENQCHWLALDVLVYFECLEVWRAEHVRRYAQCGAVCCFRKC